MTHEPAIIGLIAGSPGQSPARAGGGVACESRRHHGAGAGQSVSRRDHPGRGRATALRRDDGSVLLRVTRRRRARPCDLPAMSASAAVCGRRAGSRRGGRRVGRMDSPGAAGGSRSQLSDDVVDETATVMALARQMTGHDPLCPGCGREAPEARTGLCTCCEPGASERTTRRAELARARRRRWWARHGRAWRAARRRPSR
jgi:hypothetical protein